jgi:Flp pilus assembly protein TadG
MRPSVFRRPPVRKRSRGQGLVEFALVVPIFMLIVGGIIQFGIIFWGQNTLNQIVRDAGRYAVTEKDCLPASNTDIQNKITSLASGTFIATITLKTVTLPTNGEIINGQADPVSDKNGTAQANFCPPTSNADHVWLRIKVDAQVPVFFPALPGNGNISSTALFRMEPVTP